MNKGMIKKLSCLTLATAMCLPTFGCGEKDTIVTDYGVVDQATSDEKKSTSTDSLSVSKGDDATLREMFGNAVRFQDDFTIDTISYSGGAYFEIPDQDHLNVYNMKTADDGKKDEDAIIKALFGDTAKKIEMVQYVNKYDYISLLYKYRTVLSNQALYKLIFNNDTSYENDESFGRYVITSSSSEVFSWKDDDELYIHMYEGSYNNMTYVLLLAFDYVSNTRYIFFEPKSINEYLPDTGYQSLIVAGSNDIHGEPLGLDNACIDDIDTIKENAQSLIDNELKLKGRYEITESPKTFKSCYSDSLVDFSSQVNMTESINYDNFGSSLLMFSNTDYISTLITGVQGAAVEYRILTEQRDLIAEHKADHIGSTITEGEFLFTDSAKELMDKTTFTVDGYAVYLEGESSVDTDLSTINAISLQTSNSGIIKYTSNGLYSVDIALTDEVTDVIENVRLLEYDKIKECLKTVLENDMDKEKLGSDRDLTISTTELCYSAYIEDENSDTYSFVPSWQFLVNGIGNSKTGPIYILITINAMDGSLVDINYEYY